MGATVSQKALECCPFSFPLHWAIVGLSSGQQHGLAVTSESGQIGLHQPFASFYDPHPPDLSLAWPSHCAPVLYTTSALAMSTLVS